MITNFYLDESCYMEHDNNNLMFLSMISCPRNEYIKIKKEIKQVFLKHNFPDHFEVKSTKVSMGNLQELKNGNIVYRGKPVKFRSNPPLYGKEEGFFHIIAGFRGKPIKEDRARRLVWGKYILANEPCGKYEIDKCCEGLWVWKSDHNDPGSDRISIFHPKVSYLVIIEERKDYWLYITSYRIDSSQKKRELKLEYKKNKWP